MSNNDLNEFFGDQFLSELFDQRWEVIDAQTYFYSYNYFRILSQVVGHYGDVDDHMRRQARRLKIDLPPNDPRILAGRWIAELDRYGVSRICALAGLPGDEHSIMEASRAFPNRIIGLININPHLVVAEELLEDAVSKGTIKGICLHPCRHRFHASDELVYPIYRLAKRHHLVVYIDYGHPKCPVATRWGAQSECAEQFNSPKQLHFAASDYSSVPFVVARYLEAHTRELLRLGLLCPNVHVTTTTDDPWDESTDSVETIASLLDDFLTAFGERRILFGSGSGLFPSGWKSRRFVSLLSAMKQLRLTDERIGLVLGGNIKRLLRLDDSRLTYLITL